MRLVINDKVRVECAESVCVIDTPKEKEALRYGEPIYTTIEIRRVLC
jgi:hypothetical protein